MRKQLLSLVMLLLSLSLPACSQNEPTTDVTPPAATSSPVTETSSTDGADMPSADVAETPATDTPTAKAQTDEATGPALADDPKQTPATAEPAEETAKNVEPAEPVDITPAVALSREEIEAGWIQLFDGKTLFGWQANNDVNWSVADGVIQADKGETGLLVTTSPFANYEFKCDFRLAAGGNSGVFLRSAFQPTNPAEDCYELNICDSHAEFPTGSLVGRKKIDKPVVGEAAWKTFHVKHEGPRITVQLDGEQILDFTDESKSQLTMGLIGLQKNSGKVEFRNIYLRPLGTKPIFNGTDLTGWRDVPGTKSEFVAKDGTIHVTNGRGFLETEQTWSDFVLQFDAISNGEHLNSGVFFRALPGTEKAPSHGYELQIQNGFKDGDRTQPMDHGTGAIFRRAPARWVVPNDHEWFTTTLVAFGPHFSAWVDGYQVVDWTDTRKPSDNPREGRKLEPGHLSLQGHDPTTDLAFRNLRVAEFPKFAP